jgi:ribose/xylose/arabinose/galactoside ABC-type transport system permease subunit
MNDKLLKICKYGLWGLMGIIIVILAICLFQGETSADLQMYMTYALVILLGGAILFSPIYGIIVNPGSVKKILIAIGAFAVVALIAYLVSPGATLSQEYLESMNVTASAESICDFLMMFLYIVLGGTFVAAIGSAVYKLFN